MAEASSRAARLLVRRARAGVLATAGPGGAPFASLVTPAAAPDLSALLWLSRLARHTRNLLADPRCSLLLAGPAEGPNPQTAPRVTLIGSAAPVGDGAALKARWLGLHPYALPYAGLADFSLWRVTIDEAHFVAGFAATARLTGAEIAPDPRSVAAVAEAEPAILADCNEPTTDALARAGGGAGTGWRLVAVDVDGCDLARSETVLRIDFTSPADGPEGVRAELLRLAREG
ncbi:MAG TPA: pyridoxamine 5'-phosphate oxidase family protein [Acetobacteraceae bacterium]|nr:pyridoxamine 5'-phosphate oxidase family protein [Acetobacteraceae bacterium]